MQALEYEKDGEEYKNIYLPKYSLVIDTGKTIVIYGALLATGPFENKWIRPS